ncbi:MAG: hypothetical protein M9886_05115 [Candidatus Nanopelagicales bacterium]|nr:hypothetical protein [Candidatus Nanopelagicales bacterium]HPE11189.1 hypothetical protein [Actinomycetota bacterium]HRV64753.1 hypothetical protein [Candidatus Nanopelagicales bacterium]
MKTNAASWSRGRLIAVIAAALALLLLVGVGVYGLIAGPRQPNDPASDPTPTVVAPRESESGRPGPPRVEPSNDPDEFARNVATALFVWDTGSGLMPLDYTASILEVGDPSGEEQAGLASDIAGYLPTREAWIELRKYATIQHLTIDNSFVPEAWDQAVEQAQPGQLPAGATAITIEGTRHREGVWNGEPVTSEHTVSFTVFLACPPPAPEFRSGLCHVLRLSQLDNPLR